MAYLIEGFDAYVNEAFGVSHRRHASVVGPPQFLPSAAGRLLAKEVEVLGGLLDGPARPFVAVVGGAKVADKIGVLKVLATRVDTLIVGGGMAFTFLAALGHNVGSSLLDAEQLAACRGCWPRAPRSSCPPTSGPRTGRDVRSTRRRGRPAGRHQGHRARSHRRLDRARHRARRGGHLCRRRSPGRDGALERPDGCLRGRPLRLRHAVVAQAVAESDAFSVVGGGDSASALEELGLADRVELHLHRGWGVALFHRGNGDLPALAALRHAPNAPR